MFEAIYNKVIQDLKTGLPDSLVYHNANHTKYVLIQAASIAEKEGVQGRDLTLVKIAALYHDTGFLIQREDHEELGCSIASRDLKQYDLSSEEVAKICGMIRATHIPQRPTNLHEQIVADADLEYLGTNYFDEYSKKLHRELLHLNPNLTSQKWDEIQIDFLSKHSYHTNYCKQNKEPIKRRNLEMVKERLLTYGK